MSPIAPRRIRCNHEVRMKRFNITLVRPEGFLHAEAFHEVAETLQFGLRSIGHAANIRENVLDATATNILLGAHLLSAPEASMVLPGSILYNLEQLGGPALPKHFYELGIRHQVWDYSLRNLKTWSVLRCAFPPLHVPLGYAPELRRIKAAQVQDIDVLFYGSLNDRRSRILESLKDSGAKVHTAFGVYGKERDKLIARSKVILNIHFYDAKIFESVRVSYLLANSKAVVSECCENTEIDADLADSVMTLPYDSLVEGCHLLLQDEEKCRELETRGFQCFSQRKESEILNKALQENTSAVIRPAETNFPKKLNLGSGKDWREDHFNVDVDSYWEPDAVMDFNHPLPIGKAVQTQRFGTIVLENNSFEEIITNDVLEHISSLTTAMHSCLNLLKVGGLFRICVPYDLSWGAWQDPTHVRAFNERSWLYYTDWFWYMGWTEARFDLVKFDLKLSPVGEELQKQKMKGEELVRYPRAVDHMQVILQKRLLTEAEKDQVTVYMKRPNRSAAVARHAGHNG